MTRSDLITQNGSAPWSDWWKPAFQIASCILGLPLIATATISGKSSTEKLLTLFVQPYFVLLMVVLWVGLVLLRRGQKGAGWLLIALVAFLWIASTSVVASPVVRYWESLVSTNIPTSDKPFDYVVVLGGGTGKTPGGRAQLNDAGDRVVYAALLFLQGKTKNLITTGDAMAIRGSLSGSLEPGNDPSEQTRLIWKALGIPDENIFEVAGQNTFSELASLRDHPEWWKDSRCGLITSAFHLPRAMKLAEQAGVKVEPLAADYRSSSGPLLVQNFFPEVGELEKLSMILKEWIAIRIRR
jgi:uncharacterized SAM-binding protein YcdF (DUF218 family)